jgi:hypothetical protein
MDAGRLFASTTTGQTVGAVVGGLVDGAPVGCLVGCLVGAWVFALMVIIFMLGAHFIIPFPPHIIIIMRPRGDAAPSLAAERD